jgi:hypothetical protein
MDSDNDIDNLTDNLDGLLVHDPEKEYQLLLRSQQFSLEELGLAAETVINSSRNRYVRYSKYICFDKDEQCLYIKSLIDDFLYDKKNENKLQLIKDIDRLLLEYI